MPSPLRFLFDYVSPYAYLASTQVVAIAARHGRELEVVPVLFAGLLESTGARGPAEMPARRAYTFGNVLRLGAQLGVALRPPATHPFNPLLALRATGQVDEPALRFRFMESLFRAVWADGERIDDAAVVARLATACGVDGAALVESAQSVTGKAQLRRATEEAIAAGAFGVPTVQVDSQLFWGTDALPLLERFLSGDDPLTPELLEAWLRVAPSTSRKGNP